MLNVVYREKRRLRLRVFIKLQPHHLSLRREIKREDIKFVT